MLSDLLKNNSKIFKLVCGAGNECTQEVEKLTELYSKAGAQVFDICAKPEILKAAKSGILKSGITNDRYICVSVGMKGDPHILKASISEKCISCGKCSNICPQKAIVNNSVIKKKCIGCTACLKICPSEAISLYETDIDLKQTLPELIDMGIDCIELHATSEFDEDIWEKWDIINRLFEGIVSICIDRLNLGNKQVLSRLKKMLKPRKPYTTIIQADGVPMSGSEDSYKTTLQAVAMAEIIQNENLPVYTLISGGTNSKTSELAKLCNIDYNGIAIGSYARKIVSKYINNKDFYNPEIYEKALLVAKGLVKSI